MNRIALAVAALALVPTTAATTAVAATTASGAAPRVAAAPAWTTAPAPAIKTRTAVPWKSVGAGWITFTATAAGRTTLYLSSHTGQAYRIGQVAANATVLDVRPDGRAVVLSAGGRNQVVDLVTGRQYRPFGSAGDAVFTRPSGAALVGVTSAGAALRLVRWSYDGAVQANVATSAYAVVRSDDGRVLAATQGNHAVAYDNASLRVVRHYGLPAGFTSCAASQSFDITSFVERCTTAKGQVAQFAQGYAGGVPVRRTTVDPQETAVYALWKDGAGVIGVKGLKGSEGGVPVRVTPTQSSRIAQPAGYETQMRVVDVAAGRVFYTTARCDVGPIDVTSVDDRTHRVVRHAGRGSGVPGEVLAGVVVGGR